MHVGGQALGSLVPRGLQVARHVLRPDAALQRPEHGLRGELRHQQPRQLQQHLAEEAQQLPTNNVLHIIISYK